MIRSRIDLEDGRKLWVVGIDRHTFERLIGGGAVTVHTDELIRQGWEGPDILLTAGETNTEILESLTRAAKLSDDTLVIRER